MPTYGLNRAPLLHCRMIDPQRYRDNAARVRRLAEDIADPEVKRQMLKVATEYDDLVRVAESQAVNAAIRSNR
jgi:hypothetical protein